MPSVTSCDALQCPSQFAWTEKTVDVPLGGYKVHAWQTVRRCASANAWGDAEETEQPCRGTAWVLSDYSVSGQQAGPSGVQRTLCKVGVLYTIVSKKPVFIRLAMSPLRSEEH